MSIAARLLARTAALSAWNYTTEEQSAIVRGKRNQYGVSVLFNDGSRVLIDGATVKVRPCDIPTREAYRKRDWRIHPGLESYIATALEDFQNSDSNDEDGRDTGTIYTLHPATYESLKADYIRFRQSADRDYTEWCETYGAESFGSDFHLTRTGHGAGFWDRGAGELGERLTALCGYGTAFPPLDFYFGDDGEVYA